ncbi:MAG: transcription elongation factor GreA [Rickettsiales bacterium]|jgi:transcription elongation factor GreA|nr:transcription elongation factor GreA [Rickettsiales bacterium]
MQCRFKTTKEGFDKLKDKLDYLINTERPAISKAIGEAIALGDLSENAEYSYSKERQTVVENTIKMLTERLSLADIIDTTKLSGGDTVDFGATVYLVDEDTDKKINYKLLGEFDSDLKKNVISSESPIGRALLGRKVGDLVEIITPSGTKNFEILDIKWNQ